MARPQRDFALLDQHSRECYESFEKMGHELKQLAARAEGSAPVAPMADVDTLVHKIQNLRNQSSYAAMIPTVAFVNADAAQREAFELAFQTDAHVIALATSADALQLLKTHPIDVLISDRDICREVLTKYPQVRALVGTCNATNLKALRSFLSAS